MCTSTCLRSSGTHHLSSVDAHFLEYSKKGESHMHDLNVSEPKEADALLLLHGHPLQLTHLALNAFHLGFSIDFH